jgi:hypothetical protein
MTRPHMHGWDATHMMREAGTCNRKQRYRSRTHAKSAARWVKANLGNRQRPYHCDICYGWHLTTVEKR